MGKGHTNATDSQPKERWGGLPLCMRQKQSLPSHQDLDVATFPRPNKKGLSGTKRGPLLSRPVLPMCYEPRRSPRPVMGLQSPPALPRSLCPQRASPGCTSVPSWELMLWPHCPWALTQPHLWALTIRMWICLSFSQLVWVTRSGWSCW